MPSGTDKVHARFAIAKVHCQIVDLTTGNTYSAVTAKTVESVLAVCHKAESTKLTKHADFDTPKCLPCESGPWLLN